MKKLLIIALLISFRVSAQKTEILEDVNITSNRVKTVSSTSTTVKLDSVKTFTQESPLFFSKLPSVISQSDNGTPFGYSYFSLRGISQSHINYTLNGVPLNELEDLAAYTSNYTDLLSNLKSIQVIRGSSISSNGTSSYAGMINMEMNSAFDTTSEFSLMEGSFNSYKVSAKYSLKKSNSFGMSNRVSFTGSDGFKDYSSGKSFSAFGSVGYKMHNSRLKFNYVIGHTKNAQAWLPTPENLPIKTNLLVHDSLLPQYDNFLQQIYQLHYSLFLDNRIIFVFSPYLVKIDGNYDFPLGTDNYTGNLKLNSENWGAYLSIRRNYMHTNIQLGFSANFFHRDHVFSSSLYGNSYNTGFKREFSPYLKTDYKLKDILIESSLQLRNTDFKYQGNPVNTTVFSYSFLNYSIGISGTRKDIQPYLSFSKNSREPSRTDMFGTKDNLDTITDIRNVKPETVYDLELGIRFNQQNWKGSLNFYRMNFNNEIVNINQLNPFSIALRENVNSSYKMGIEGEYLVRIKKLELGSNFNFSSNYINNDDSTFILKQPVLTPTIITNNYIAYKLKKLSLKLDYKYVNSSFLEPANNKKYMLPEYHLLDFQAGYDNKKYSVSIFVNNLLNINWKLSGNTDGITKNYFYSAGTNLYITFTQKL